MNQAYNIISSFYGNQVAKRSQVPLINHIDEGLYILNKINSTDLVKDAYCLHPILQSDEMFNSNIKYDFGGIDTSVIILTMEYRRVANSYLSKNKLEDFVGFSCQEVKEMLIADKVQNYKDFINYHYHTHERSNELFQYFHNWFVLLDIKYTNFLKFNNIERKLEYHEI